MNNLEEVLKNIPEITEKELEQIEESNAQDISTRIYFYANKASLRKDTRRGRLYGNWQRQVTAPCSFSAKLYLKITDILRKEELSNTCRNGDVIVEVLSKGFAQIR